MKTRAEFLAWKRQQLMAESALHRAELVRQLQPLTHRLASIESGVRIADRIRRHPGWIGAAALGLIVLTPRRVSSILRFGTEGLRSWQRLAPTLRTLMRPPD